MTRAPGPRDRLIATAIAMVQERGIHATGLSDLLRRSSAARNSIYQHFPGGKTELMVAVTETAAAGAAARVETLAEDATTPADVVSAIIEDWVAAMELTDFDTGCPIAAAALVGPDEPAITAAAAAAFMVLQERISSSLILAGTRAESAMSVASFMVSAVEGALLQARALRSVQPLRDVQTVLPRLLD
jgi:TetR/AcrR family transcriptional regulator, lmrAB and yxaGH operons repressor